MAEKSGDLGDVLLRAKLSLDEALTSAERAGVLSPATLGQLSRAKESLNTGCTNTGCGKAALEELASQPATRR